MARIVERRNVDWPTPEGKDFTWTHVQTEVLMDIREELKRLNRLLHCQNVIGGFKALQRLDRRLAKKVPLK